MLENLQRLPVEIVERYLETRDHKKMGISEPLGKYILELNEASNLYRRYRSISECAAKMQVAFPYISLATCKSRIYDAINFFNSDCSVTSPAWDNYFADQMMKLADVNLVAHNFSEVRRCFEKAREYRREASANIVDPQRTRFKPQIVSADISLDRMGVTDAKGILQCWKESKAIIESKKDISQSERDRLMDEAARELNITNVEIEESDED